ncbi:MAG TPA: thrombospondin type 3 repeat-containing protein, partial [Myxococcota bacterium]|nr:thrombospondin type 3 repeat-containing protein [Myxococcota bacterium]
MRTLTFLGLSSIILLACSEEKKRPIGGTCGGDSECSSGLCLYGECLDPAGDEDGDGLINGREGALGSNPFNPDSDYDGVGDLAEVGDADPIDSDGDGRFDVVESLTEDMDGDCIPDQLDVDDTVMASEADVQAQAAALCGTTGVCRDFPGGIAVSCAAGQVQCDYSGIAQFQAEESTCDGLDNDCDGLADEGQPDLDGNGVADCVDTDIDGDAVANETDNCPAAKNDGQADADGDGLGDACDAPALPMLTGFSPVSPNNAASVMAMGTGEALSTVEVFGDDKCTDSRGEGEVGTAGSWQATITLESGVNVFSLRATNRAGLSSSCIAQALTFDRDEDPPAVPLTHAVVALTWGERGETFEVSGETEPGASVQVFTDASCGTAISAAELAAAGLFRVTTQVVPTTTAMLYVRAVDAAGNTGPCGPAGAAFGPLTVRVVNSDDKAVSQVAVQFHYPDGEPASPVLFSDNNGVVTVEGFAGYSATVDLTQSQQFGFDWSTVFGLVPSGEIKVVRRINSFTETFSYSLNLTFPAAPPGTSWINVFAPCGTHYVQAGEGAERGSLSIAAPCFPGASFDIALVAMGSDGRATHHLVKSNVPTPTGEANTIAFTGAWSATGWYESTFSVETLVPVAFDVAMSIASRGAILDSSDYENGGSALSAPQRPGVVEVSTPPIPGSLGRWRVEVPVLVLDGISRVGLSVGQGERLPLTVDLDAQSDFMPRIYELEAIYPPPSPAGGPSWVPLEVRW